MPAYEPPDECPGIPVIETREAGTLLTRVHSAKLLGNAFNHGANRSSDSGGRFDSYDGDYGWLYASDTEGGAFAETFVRMVDQHGSGVRPLLPAAVQGRVVSRILLTKAVDLVSLRGSGLHQLGQDAWLVTCGEESYPLTRRWARAIRRWAPQATGFVWRGRRDQEELAYVLFQDNDDGFVRTEVTEPLDSGPALVRLRAVLRQHRISLPRTFGV